MIYGTVPEALGKVDVENNESMLYLYLPIKLAGQSEVSLPKNLKKFQPIVDAVRGSMGIYYWVNRNVYITVKAMYVDGTNTAQRPGWHSDGFMTDDLNFLWYDSEPTDFYCGGLLRLTQDHEQSLVEMAEIGEDDVVNYPEKTLLLLDEFVIHRPKPEMKHGFRTFVKVSISEHIYALEGNSVNYDPAIFHETSKWVYAKRSDSRNCPARGGL